MMPTEVFEFRASRLGSFLILIGSVVFAAAGLILWYQPDAPYDLRLWMGLFGIGAACVFFVVLYRLVVGPVMVRVSPEGLFIKNYDATIPWEALETVRLVMIENRGEMLELVPKAPLHSTLATGKFALGKQVNNLAGLPDYAYSMTGIRGTNQDLMRAISVYI
ncbi:hypothetical protein [Hirschia maritima]|uniref:hypothetical protein n=1 Tax=Hirschia maritima TaxID=1121961 RepID=UPI001F234F27|nr:hypothetical protein [Hirschia maritima]